MPQLIFFYAAWQNSRYSYSKAYFVQSCEANQGLTEGRHFESCPFLKLTEMDTNIKHVTCMSLSNCSRWYLCQVRNAGPSWEKSIPSKLCCPCPRKVFLTE